MIFLTDSLRETFVGSSQISRWTAYVLSIEGDDIVLWDPEIGVHYKLSDSRCSLIKVYRLINHAGVSIKNSA